MASFFQKHSLKSFGHLLVSTKSVLAYRIFFFFDYKASAFVSGPLYPISEFCTSVGIADNKVNWVTSGSHQTKCISLCFCDGGMDAGIA